jgi:TRAP-type C4-dicarboxylate transport system permease small subunit
MIAIRFLGDALGPKVSQVLDTLGSTLMAILMLLIAWKVSERAISDWSAGYKTVNIGLPLAPTWVMVSVLLTLSAWVQWRLAWRDIAALMSTSTRSAHG